MSAFQARHFHQRILIQLSLAAGFVTLAFQVGLRQHLQFLQGAEHQRLLQRGQHRFCIHHLRMTQKVKPNVQPARQHAGRLRELGQLQNVELQVVR